MFRKKIASQNDTGPPRKSPVIKCGGFMPQTVFLLGTYNQDGTPNLCTATSVSYAYGPPESLVVSLFGNSRTRENINRTGSFTANICTSAMGRLADYVGGVSGSHQEKDGVPFVCERGEKIKAPSLKESPYTMECRVTFIHKVGDTVILVSEIVNHMVDIRLGRPVDDSDEAWFNWLNESDALKIDPLLYSWRYYKLGTELGKLGRLAEDLIGEEGGLFK
jgi:flavin reductase (DIM6/NTAB) family NADH-FMN oxidoreductase RutF